MPESHDCGTDAAAYVLGALEPAEAARFRRHLEMCAICQAEVGSLEELAAELPLTAPHHVAPEGLRRRVMAEVNAEVPVHTRTRTRFPRVRAIVLAPAVGLTVAALAFAGIELTAVGGTAVYAASVGDAQLRVTNGHGELIVHKLPQPHRNRVYEVWLQRGSGNPQPTAALFSVTASGDGAVDVPGNLRNVSKVLVTQEPAGGSKVPSSAPVIVARLG